MNDADLLTATVVALRDAYRQAALEHAAAIGKGRHRVANRNFDVLAALVRELRSRGRDGERVLEELLADGEVAVRVWAATHALPFASKAAETVLSEIAAGPPSPLRLAAEVTLVEWKAGRLQNN